MAAQRRKRTAKQPAPQLTSAWAEPQPFPGGSWSCVACKRACRDGEGGYTLVPHEEDDDSSELTRLVGFNVARASNTLMRLLHETPGHELGEQEPKRAATVRTAYYSTFQLERWRGPERLSEREWLAAIRGMKEPLAAFLEAAQRREKEELQKHRRTTYVGPPELRTHVVTGIALRLAISLQRALSWLERKWAFDGHLRTLPGTTDGKRKLHQRALAQVYATLAEAFSHREIAELDLDGCGGSVESAQERVRKAIKRFREQGRAVKEIPGDPTPGQ